MHYVTSDRTLVGAVAFELENIRLPPAKRRVKYVRTFRSFVLFFKCVGHHFSPNLNILVMGEQRNNAIDEVQSLQYSFPYHYLPTVTGFPYFSKGWSFSASYIAAINLFVDWLETERHGASPRLHMDYGCGDGGFVYHVKRLNAFDDIEFWGIDFDANAIDWAKKFSKTENFICGDVAGLPPSNYDSGSLVEVYEHVPPNECPVFLKNIANSLKKDAKLFVTVPSSQKQVGKKHYRHFDFDILTREFSEDFVVENIFGFEKRTRYTKLINRLLSSRWWVIETKFTSRFFISTLQKKYSKIEGCGRIGLIVRKK